MNKILEIQPMRKIDQICVLMGRICNGTVYAEEIMSILSSSQEGALHWRVRSVVP